MKNFHFSLTLALLGAFFVSGCATESGPAPEPMHTASGKAEAIFANKTPQDVSGLIASRCADRGLSITESTSSLVICEGKLNFGQSFVTQLALGNEYSTPPQMFVRFNLFAVGSDSRVQATQWVETTMAFGQRRTMEITNRRSLRGIEDMLVSLGGKEPNT